MYWRFSSCSARSSAERSKMRASAMPISLSAFLTVSVSNSLLPTNVSELMVGRSCTDTTRMSPCASMRTSRKKPVAYSAFTACATFSSSTRSPTLIGRYEKIVPASVRCTPSTRMSRTVKGSNAHRRGVDRHAQRGDQRWHARRRSVRRTGVRISAATAAGQNRRETSLNRAKAISTASMAMPMRWPTSNARSDTGLPLKISAK